MFRCVTLVLVPPDGKVHCLKQRARSLHVMHCVSYPLIPEVHTGPGVAASHSRPAPCGQQMDLVWFALLWYFVVTDDREGGHPFPWELGRHRVHRIDAA